MKRTENYTRQMHEGNEDRFEGLVLYGLELALVWGTLFGGIYEMNKIFNEMGNPQSKIEQIVYDHRE